MKIRNGFVSNSSSASFIISKDAYENVFDLSCQMIQHRGKDRGGNDDGSGFYKEPNVRLCNILENEKLDGRDPDTPVSFPTCNYDTYIARLESGEFVVDTCNNHHFYVMLNGILNSYGDDEGDTRYFPKELKKLGYDDIYDIDLNHLFDFFFPQYMVLGRREDLFTTCDKCYAEKIHLKKNDKVVCPICEMMSSYRDWAEEKLSDEDKKIVEEFGRTFRKLDIRDDDE